MARLPKGWHLTVLTIVNSFRRLRSMEKRRFGDILRKARLEKGLSLRQLADRSGLDYSRLAKIESGTRPAPDLTAIRALSDALGLDLSNLIVAAGTSREVVENLVWSERLALGARERTAAVYRPEEHDETRRHRFTVSVRDRRGGECHVTLGEDVLSVFSFSEDERLLIEIPPESVIVFRDDPAALLGHSNNVFRARVRKARKVGPILDLVLQGRGYELNAKIGRDRSDALGVVEGMDLFAFLPPAAIRTFPVNE